MKRQPFSLKNFTRYFFSFLGYFTLSVADGNFSPFALSLLTANLFVGLNPFSSFLLYILSFVPSFNPLTVLWAGAGGITVAVSFAVYRKNSKTPSFEIVLILALALSPFVALSKNRPLPINLIISCAIIILSFLMTAGARVWLIKGLKYKLSQSEIISSAVIYSLCSYGSIIAFGEGFCLATAIFATCFCTLFLKPSSSLVTAIITAFPISVYRLDLTPFALLSLFALCISTINEYSRLFSAIGGILTVLGFYFLTDFFVGVTPYYFLAPSVSMLIFLFFPEKTAKKIRAKIKVHNTDNIGRYFVNLTRSSISGQLYEMSAVFDEMSSSILKIQNLHDLKEDKNQVVCDDIIISVCSLCPEFLKCRAKDFPPNDELLKLTELGFAKGVLSPADMPKNFISKCSQPAEILNKVNSLIDKSLKLMESEEALSQSRELIIRQTKGVSNCLKSMATKLGRQLELIPEKERKIHDNLLRCGIFVKEISVFKGEEEEINLVLFHSDVFSPVFLKAIEEITGYKSIVSNITSLSNELSAVTVKKRPIFDAAFGIASKVMDGREKSGDTHTVVKLSEGKFLIALNDGMGSGKGAEETSSTAISLVETFFKAGIDAETVLSTVNKILTFSKEDNFTAMDIGVVDLHLGTANFIKIGSPFSFIITRDSVKIIEGNSLPLGILDEMKPTVCSSPVQNGDMIVFLSDGICDSFSSSADLIDFLSTQRALNPKTLADSILEKALFLNDGKAIDDMTAFCVRIFINERAETQLKGVG
ncbi:MAG: hypothetical protein E7360_03090 [Clostridiales bacterium]|nr:hypothetical protein [Clostridiales bacterium]